MADYPNGSEKLVKRLAAVAVDPRRWPKALLGLLRLMYWPIRRLFIRTCAYGSYLRGRARSRTDFIEERWRGLQDLSAASRVAVFNHYDPRGVLHDFVADYVRQLTEAGFTTIFVSNSPSLPRETIDRLLPSCALLLRRANIGYDFGALKDGIAQIPRLDRIDALLLANDSVYGPFHALRDIVVSMDNSADVWGITDCWEQRYHLQSFFLLFGRPALQSPAFARFWSRVAYVQSKDWIIEQYEIGLTRALMAAGLRCRALYPYRQVATALLEAVRGGKLLQAEGLDQNQMNHIRLLYDLVRRDAPLNSTHYFWDYLIECMGCPFLKRELLRDNPMGIPFVQHWEKVVRSASAYDTGLIARHLEATLDGRAVPDPAPAGSQPRPWYALEPRRASIDE